MDSREPMSSTYKRISAHLLLIDTAKMFQLKAQLSFLLLICENCVTLALKESYDRTLGNNHITKTWKGLAARDLGDVLESNSEYQVDKYKNYIGNVAIGNFAGRTTNILNKDNRKESPIKNKTAKTPSWHHVASTRFGEGKGVGDSFLELKAAKSYRILYPEQLMTKTEDETPDRGAADVSTKIKAILKQYQMLHQPQQTSFPSKDQRLASQRKVVNYGAQAYHYGTGPLGKFGEYNNKYLSINLIGQYLHFLSFGTSSTIAC